MSKTYVLDANALLDFVEDGAGADRVERLFTDARQARVPLLMSVVNWGEVLYHLWQERGEEPAKRTMAALSRFPLELIPVDLPHALKAAELKARHKIPYVDCVAAALAVLQQAVLVTADRDFEKLGRHFPVLWISRP